MKHIWTITGAALLAAACATPASYPRGHVRTVDPEAQRREEEIAHLTAARIDHARELARESLARVAAAASEDEQRRLLARSWSLSRGVLSDQEPGALAALAPQVFRIYDLGAALDGGPDAAENTETLLTEPRDEAIDGEQALLRRIAADLRAADAGRWGRDTFVEAVGECLLVLQHAGNFSAVERDLDRLATTGGGFVRLRILVAETEHAGTEPPRWTAADYDARVADTLAAGGSPQELTVDIPYGRSRGAFDGVQASYVQDFDVDAPSGLADPLVGTLRAGLVVSATYGAPAQSGSPHLDLKVARSSYVEPIPEFTTLIEPGATPVTIQIPEARVVSLSDGVVPTARGAAREAVAQQIEIDDETLPAVRVVVHTQAHGSPADARPAWRRVLPAAATARFEAPLLEQAAPLAGLHLAQGDHRRAQAEIRYALTTAEGQVWRTRLRVSPDTPEGVLIRWPCPVSDPDTERALRESRAAPADGCGFIDVTAGMVVAFVSPESAGCVARVLGSLRRRPPNAGTRVAFDGSTDDSLRCTASNQISFVQDFDVEVAEGAAIADPIIGVMQEGAVAEAVPVAGAAPGTYDVRITHAAVHQPIQEFTTSLSRGSPVTIQLPRLHIRTTWRRVVLTNGESVEMETRVGAGTDEDVRRFVLRAID